MRPVTAAYLASVQRRAAAAADRYDEALDRFVAGHETPKLLLEALSAECHETQEIYLAVRARATREARKLETA